MAITTGRDRTRGVCVGLFEQFWGPALKARVGGLRGIRSHILQPDEMRDARVNLRVGFHVPIFVLCGILNLSHEPFVPEYLPVHCFALARLRAVRHHPVLVILRLPASPSSGLALS
jgi:hypothetical protein